MVTLDLAVMRQSTRRNHSNETKSYAVLALGLLGMGFSGIFVTLAGAPGAAAGFYRMAIACVPLAVPFYFQARKHWPLPRREAMFSVLAGLFFAGDIYFWNTGILISGATNPTLMGNTAPIWVGLGSMIFFGEKLSRRFWMGLFLALSGAAVILGADALNSVGLGTFFGLLAGVFYGAYFLALQRSRVRLEALTSFWIAAATSAVVLAVVAQLLHQPLTGYSIQTYLYLTGLALIVQVGGQLAINFALGYLPASLVSPTLLLQPVLTGLLAVPLLGQPLTAVQVAGGAVVLVGVYIVHHSRMPVPAAVD